MKRHVVGLLILILLGVSPLLAWEFTLAGGWGGFNSSRYSHAALADSQKSRFGLSGGAFVEMNPFDDWPQLSIQPQLSLDCWGSRWEEVFSGETWKARSDISFLHFAVPVKYSLSSGQGQASKIKPFVFAGPYAGLKLGAKAKVEWLGETTTETIDDVRGADFGLLFGAGADFDSGRNRFSVSLRYNLGLSRISKTEGILEKFSVISISASYSYRLFGPPKF